MKSALYRRQLCQPQGQRHTGRHQTPGHRWYCKLDIRAFFPSVDRAILRQLWHRALTRLPHDQTTRERLNQVALAFSAQNRIDPPPAISGRRHLLAQIPPHKSLFHTPPGKGLPIGSLSSQFFPMCIFMNLTTSSNTRSRSGNTCATRTTSFFWLAVPPSWWPSSRPSIFFCVSNWALKSTPTRQSCNAAHRRGFSGGHRVSPSEAHASAQRALRMRLASFTHLIFGRGGPGGVPEARNKWLSSHNACSSPGIPTAVLLQKMLATLNRYYGMYGHANTWRLRKYIYEVELGRLRQFLYSRRAELPSFTNSQGMAARAGHILTRGTRTSTAWQEECRSARHLNNPSQNLQGNGIIATISCSGRAVIKA